MTLRVALVAPVKPDPWRAYNLDQGYAGLARQGSEAGWSVEIIDPAKAALSSGHPPIVTGPGPAAVTRALRLG